MIAMSNRSGMMVIHVGLPAIFTDTKDTKKLLMRTSASVEDIDDRCHQQAEDTSTALICEEEEQLLYLPPITITQRTTALH